MAVDQLERAHCHDRNCRQQSGHPWRDDESPNKLLVCEGHDENGGSEVDARGRLRIYCTCGLWVRTELEN